MSASEYTAYDSFKQVFVHLFIADQLPFGKGGLKRLSPLKQFSYSSSSVFFQRSLLSDALVVALPYFNEMVFHMQQYTADCCIYLAFVFVAAC